MSSSEKETNSHPSGAPESTTEKAVHVPDDGASMLTLEAATAIGFYCTVSIGIVLLNKALFRMLDAPIFITWFQMVFTIVASAVCGFLGQRYRRPPIV